MIWLNTGCPVIIKQDKLELKRPRIFHKNYRRSQFMAIFTQLMEGKIEPIDACNRFSDEYERITEEKQKNIFFSQIFQLLPICLLSQDENKDFRQNMIEIGQKINLPQSIDPNARMCCHLAFGHTKKEFEREFRNKYIQNGGTKKAMHLLLKIHDLAPCTGNDSHQSVDWWHQELCEYENNLSASDFDIKFINFLTENDFINCGDPILTMVITLFFYSDQMTRTIIEDYAKIHFIDLTPEQKFFKQILTFSLIDELKKQNQNSFIGDIYKHFHEEEFTLYLLSVLYMHFNDQATEKPKTVNFDATATIKGKNESQPVKKPAEEQPIKQSTLPVNSKHLAEFRLAILRYSEFLLSTGEVDFIPTFLNYGYISGTKYKRKETNESNQLNNDVLLLLETVKPAITFLDDLPETFRRQIDNMPRFENNDFMQRFSQNKLDYAVRDKGTILLPYNFFRYDNETQLAVTKWVLNLPKEKRRDLMGTHTSVLVGMIDTMNTYTDELETEEKYANELNAEEDDQNFIDQKVFLEEELFDYIAENGDLPEFSPEDQRSQKLSEQSK